MMLFQRRIFVELLLNTLGTLLLLTLVLVLISSAQVVHRTEGLTLASFARTVPIYAASLLDITLPIAVLVAVVVSFGRAAADNEIDVLRASGVRPLHVLVPGLVFGALMAVGLLLAMDWAKPLAERAQKRAIKDVDLATLLRNKLSAGEPVELDDHTVVSAEGFDAQGHAEGFRVQLLTDDGALEREIVAQWAELRLNRTTSEFEITLHDFHAVKGSALAGAQMDIRRPLPKEIARLYSEHMTTPQVLAWLARDPSRRADFTVDEAELAVHGRLASSLACLLFVLIGVPVALMFRRHDRTGAFLLAFLLALFVYYPSQQISEGLARSDALSPFAASWSGNAFMLLIGLALSFRVFRR